MKNSEIYTSSQPHRHSNKLVVSLVVASSAMLGSTAALYTMHNAAIAKLNNMDEQNTELRAENAALAHASKHPSQDIIREAIKPVVQDAAKQVMGSTLALCAEQVLTPVSHKAFTEAYISEGSIKDGHVTFLLCEPNTTECEELIVGVTRIASRPVTVPPNMGMREIAANIKFE